MGQRNAWLKEPLHGRRKAQCLGWFQGRSSSCYVIDSINAHVRTLQFTALYVILAANALSADGLYGHALDFDALDGPLVWRIILRWHAHE